MLNLKENNLKEKTLESLIRTKLFKSEDELLKEAIDALFYKRPELKREVAVDMYKNKEISLWKATQMCGVSLEEFKEILRSRGIKIEIEATKQEGYDFPIRVFQKARVLSLSSEKEFKDVPVLSQKPKS